MSLPRWMLFPPLIVVVAAGLTTRRHPRTPPRSEPAGATGATATRLSVQVPRALDAAPAQVTPKSKAGTSDRLAALEPVSDLPAALGMQNVPVPAASLSSLSSLSPLRSPMTGGAAVAALETSAAAGGRAARAGGRGAMESDLSEAAGSGASGRRRDRVGARAGRSGAGDDEFETTPARWNPPRYDAWSPPPVYGPPCPPERLFARRQAHRLLADMEAGRLQVMMDERDGEQLRCLERDGVYGWPAPPPGVVARSARQRDALEGVWEDALESPPEQSSGETNGAALASGRGARKKRVGAQSPAGDALPYAPPLLASRGALPRRSPPLNPADDPDFDPCVLPPAPGLLRLLTTLAAHSTPARPLTVMSLLRPPYRFGGFVHVGPANPHSLGLAVDIAAYGGHAVRQSEPEQCVFATLALLRDLPPGRYRLGMPKAPEGGWELPPALSALLRRAESEPVVGASVAVSDSDASARKPSPSAFQNVSETTGSSGDANAPGRSPALRGPVFAPAAPFASPDKPGAVPETVSATGCAAAALYGMYASSAKPLWPFFPPPYAEWSGSAQASPGSAMPDVAPPDRSTPLSPEQATLPLGKIVLRFQNEAYAPEDGIADARIRRALLMARLRGVEIVALFPDGADHIHVDVRRNP